MQPMRGVFTALVTPTRGRGEIDWEGTRSLLSFQAKARVDGVVLGGTTGESPTLSHGELERLVRLALEELPSRVRVVMGVGKNSLEETCGLARFAREAGVQDAMVVEPYYNAPSSPEVRREFLGPLASQFPDLQFLVYSIPARTGTRMHPIDLALLHEEHANVSALKDACGDDTYSRGVRSLLPRPFSLLSGDDARTLSMMRNPASAADGVVSVASNLAPFSVRAFVDAALDGAWERAERAAQALEPLFQNVTIRVQEPTPRGEVPVVSRNPVPVKAALAVLGLPGGLCRAPLGRLTPLGLERLVGSLREARGRDPEIFSPIERHFGVSVAERLASPGPWRGVAYERY
ncbi:MAG: dihydrodipicolinate synthase family protein [Euryarchaeota archaeon]|nr:dihydrodipicolinate synthase family protein [Euryarchaeota archaeon]MDE1835046.1 dihydrodipicolinate synthase family protein [Euryarchaeota archaeon]MDE1879317.1 dihydrodipicolinate synthase family protein [Euryarchaeota archaeon]MDE2044885.1 dihydrodipicolinate synthase family protein [Thermoplasmata archaeon]